MSARVKKMCRNIPSAFGRTKGWLERMARVITGTSQCFREFDDVPRAFDYSAMYSKLVGMCFVLDTESVKMKKGED
jgi:hypothetical protein